MSEDIIKLSGMQRLANSVNPGDLMLISRYDIPGYDSFSISVQDLLSLVAKENVYSSIADGMNATILNEYFYVYTDSTQNFVYGYQNRGGGAYQQNVLNGNVRVYPTYKLFEQMNTVYGAGVIKGVASFAALRTLPVLYEGQRVRLDEYDSGLGFGGGEFIGHFGTRIDDGGITAAGNGFYWSRRLTQTNFIDLNYWGTLPGGDISDACIAAVAAAKALNIGQIMFPATQWNVPYIISKQIVVDYTDGKFIFFSGSVSSKIGTTLLSTVANGPTFIFSRNNATANYFWTTGGIEKLTINADPTIQSSTTASAIQVSDTWGFIIEKVRILNFKYGQGIILKNSTAWTEGTKIIDVDIRTTQIGLLFTRDTSVGSTATNSFMGTVIEKYSFQAGTGLAGTTGIQVGDDTTVAAQLECKVYASEITMRYWAEGGGFNFGVRVRGYSGIGDSIVKVIPDGIGLSFDQVVTATPYKSISVEVNGYYNANTTVLPYQGHLNVIKLSYLAFALESAFTYDRSATTNVTLYKGFPLVQPRGLIIKGYEELTVAQQTAGVSIGIFNLPVGCVMRVTLRYFNSLLPANIQVSSYLVRVNGSGLFTTVAPENPDILNVLTTTSATVSGTSVLTGATIAASRSRVNDFIDTTTAFKPIVKNGNTTQTNKDGLGSDTRNFKIVVPANSGATDILCLSAELEFL